VTARDLTPSVLAAIQATDVRPALFFEGEFESGTVRLWTGFGTVTWNGHEWQGAGTLGGISEIEETRGIVASGVTVFLSGVNPALVSVAIGEARQGLPGKIWIGFLTDAGEVIADPFAAFSGRLDVPEIADGEETATISISYESRLIDLNRPREWRYTEESQRVDHPEDRGFEFVTKIQDIEFVWNRT
jgi:hypothetical protein